ncbi:MAG: translocation/assembly module TamB domain-containing protein [Gammaproteobacteria bacterium]|nr:translocation/assembly module TamB domain-containing protein [Gammaproteobacteria bacterium]
MIKRWLKRTLASVLLIAILLVISTVVILHTEWGTRNAISFVTKQTAGLEIEKVEGTLGSKLKLSGVQYSDPSINVKVGQLNWQMNSYNLFSQSYVIDEINIVDSLLVTKKQAPSSESPEFAGLSLPFRIQVEHLIFENTKISNGEQDYTINELSLTLKAEDNLIDVKQLKLKSEAIDLNSDIELHLTKTLNFKSQHQWQLSQADTSINGAGSIAGDLANIKLVKNIKVTGKNDLSADSVVSAHINLSSKEPEVELLLEKLNYQQQLNSNKIKVTDGSLEISGVPSDYQIIFTGPAHFNQERLQLSAQGKGNLDKISFEQFNIDAKTLKLSTQADLSWREYLAATITGNIQANELHQWDKQLAGEIQGDFNLGIKQLNGQFDLTIKDTSFSGTINQQKFDSKFELTANEKLVDIQSAIINLGANSIQAYGVITEESVNAKFDINAPILSKFSPDLKGSIIGKSSITGTFGSPIIDSQFNAKNLQYKHHKVQKLNFTASGNPYKDIKIIGQVDELSTGESVLANIGFQLSGNLSKHIATIELDSKELSSKLDLNGSFNQTAKVWLATIEQHQVTDKQLNTDWQLQKAFKLNTSKTVRIEDACWQESHSSSHLCFTFDNSQYSPALEVRAEDFDLKLFKSLLPSSIQLEGSLNGNLNLVLADNKSSYDPNLDSKLTLLNGKISVLDKNKVLYQQAITQAELTATSKNTNNHLNLLLKLQDDTGLQLDLNIDKQLELNGRLTAELTRTYYLTNLISEIQKIQGPATLDANISGAWINPKLDLNFNHDGAIQLRTLGPALTQSQLKIKDIGESLYQVSATTLSNDVPINFNGRLEVFNYRNNQWRYYGKLNADRFQLIKTEELDLIISPDIVLELTPLQANITGDLVINEGSLRLQELPEGAVISSEDVVIEDAPTESEQFKVNLNVQTRIENKFKVEALGLESDVQGKLQLSNLNKSNALQGFGQLTLTDGSYTIYGQKLKLDKGILLFDGSLENPQIDLIATRLSDDENVTAGINIGGTPNYLQSSLFSTPSLSDIEILSYLTTGKGLAEEGEITKEQMVQAALVLGLKKSSPLFTEIQSSLGIDVFTLKESSSSDDTAIEAGKNLNEQLYLGYSHGIFNRSGFWLIRYKISKALKLESTYGDSQSIDIIYTIKTN